MNELLTFLLAALAVWRITYMLNGEYGPGGIFARLRAWAARNDDSKGGINAALNCVYCLSIWVALPVALLLQGITNFLLYWFALSAAAILIDNLHEKLTSGE